MEKWQMEVTSQGCYAVGASQSIKKLFPSLIYAHSHSRFHDIIPGPPLVIFFLRQQRSHIRLSVCPFLPFAVLKFTLQEVHFACLCPPKMRWKTHSPSKPLFRIRKISKRDREAKKKKSLKTTGSDNSVSVNPGIKTRHALEPVTIWTSLIYC